MLRIFPALAVSMAFLLSPCDAKPRQHPHRRHILSVDTEEITQLGYRGCNGGNGISPNPGVIQLRLKNVFAELKNGQIGRDVDYQRNSQPIEPVTNPEITTDWPTELDMKFEKPWLKGGFTILRIMLLKHEKTSDGKTDEDRNIKADFLVPIRGKRFDAVRRGTEASGMICGHSGIRFSVPYSKTGHDGVTITRTYDEVDVYFQNPPDKKHVEESINIGLLVGPSGGHRIPIFLDPKVHNEGYP